MIKIGDKEYPFHFALKAQKEMQQCEDLTKKEDSYFIYLGLKYGALDNGQKWELTEDQVLDMLEKDMDAFGRAADLLAKQMDSLKKKRANLIKILYQ